MGLNGDYREVLRQLREFGFQNATFQTGIAELEEVFMTLEKLDTEVEARADMLIVRGLDYYTGTVFETIAPDYREIGSICSGGRYENLARHYTDQKLPGVGGSIGLTRLFYILQNYGLVEASDLKPIDVCLVPFSETEYSSVAKLADRLRADGKSVDIVLSDKKLGDKMKYAAKTAKYVAVLGEDEIKSGEYKLRDLESGEETVQEL